MNPIEHQILQTRREFLATSANGVGMMGLGALLAQEGILSADTVANADP
ncbi:MAG: twin-arginine translocation signal domain-containing protein, partial [Prosthecobacter sp.]